jgi:hypothetical protein
MLALEEIVQEDDVDETDNDGEVWPLFVLHVAVKGDGKKNSESMEDFVATANDLGDEVDNGLSILIV